MNAKIQAHLDRARAASSNRSVDALCDAVEELANSLGGSVPVRVKSPAKAKKTVAKKSVEAPVTL